MNLFKLNKLGIATIVEDTNILHIYLNYVIKETGEINSYNLDVTPDDNPDKI